MLTASNQEENKPLWIQIDYYNVYKRRNHASVLFKNFAISLWGRSMQANTHSIAVLDLDTYTCYEETPLGQKPVPRNSHTACLYKENQIIVYGGASEKTALGETAMLTIHGTQPFSSEWQIMQTEGGSNFNRMGHTANIYRNHMYVFGGKISADGHASNELWALDLETWIWKKCQISTTDYLSARQYHCSALYQGSLYIFGGFEDESFQPISMEYIDIINLGNEFKYNKLNNWLKDTMEHTLVNALESNVDSRAFTSAQEKEGKIYLFGGHNGSGYLKDFSVYNIKDNAWSQIKTKNEVPCKKAEHTLINYKNNFIILGGSGKEDDSNIYVLSFGGGLTAEENNNNGNIVKFNDNEFGQQMGTILNDANFSDICFKVEDQEFFAYKGILSARCKYFDQMFRSGMTEANAKVVSVPDVKAETFKALLEFIYTNQLRLTEDLALDLFNLSSKWCLPEIQNKCEIFLSTRISLVNFVQVAEVAELHESSILRQSVINWIIQNAETLDGSEELCKLSHQLLLKAILKQKGKNH